MSQQPGKYQRTAGRRERKFRLDRGMGAKGELHYQIQRGDETPLCGDSLIALEARLAKIVPTLTKPVDGSKLD